jgi:uncharacterized protein (DUF4415 family)
MTRTTKKKRGRPPIGAGPRVLIHLRVDPQVLTRVKQLARRHDLGYQTYLNDMLARAVARETAKGGR